MDLKAYYYAEPTELSLEEVAQLRTDILDLLRTFENYQTKFSRQALQNTAFTENFRLLGFARYLNDFQGKHDVIFAPYRHLFCDLFSVVADMEIPFGQQYHRLLEIGRRSDWAPMYADIEDIARFILKNFKEYDNKEMLFKIYERLSYVKKTGKLQQNSYADILYQIVKKRLPFWKR